MANKKFDASRPFMSDSIVSMSNGLWDIELFWSRAENRPEFRFDGPNAKWTFGHLLHDDSIKLEPGPAYDISVPKYVQDFARRMYRECI